MLFSRKRAHASAARIAIFASVAITVAAVYSWDIPLKTIGQYFLITLVLVGGLVLLAGLTVLVVKGLQKLVRRPDDR